MDPRLFELGVRKERVLLRIALERADAEHRLLGITAALDRVDRLRDGVRAQFHWQKQKVPVLTLAALTVLATRPRFALRVARRAWVGWVLVQRLRGRPLAGLAPALAPLLQMLVKSRVLNRGGRPRR